MFCETPPHLKHHPQPRSPRSTPRPGFRQQPMSGGNGLTRDSDIFQDVSNKDLSLCLPPNGITQCPVGHYTLYSVP
ncbi:hypothetical protein AOLI_G00219760 [Acnodon oligacanthus]